MSVLYIGKTQAGHHTPDAVSQVPQRGKITSLELLAIFMLIQPRKQLAFAALIGWPFCLVNFISNLSFTEI